MFHNKAGDFKNESYWQKTSQHPCFKQLNKDIKTDILIIGGGLSGISCAYQLKETGKQITIVEKNLLGSHTSGHTTAKITLLQGLIYQKLVKHYNIETAYLYYQSQKEAIKGIKDLIEKENELEMKFKATLNFKNEVQGKVEGSINYNKERYALIKGDKGEIYVPMFNRVVEYTIHLENEVMQKTYPIEGDDMTLEIQALINHNLYKLYLNDIFP